MRIFGPFLGRRTRFRVRPGLWTIEEHKNPTYLSKSVADKSAIRAKYKVHFLETTIETSSLWELQIPNWISAGELERMAHSLLIYLTAFQFFKIIK